MSEDRNICCDAWRKARQSGSDNEGWSALIHWFDGFPCMGCGLPPVRFCPWCGKKK